jgi:gluconokinase
VTGCVVVMGVAGSGKSTVGAALAGRLGWTFLDADDFHPPANVDKMRRGEPLDEADRSPWLARLNQLLRSHLDRDDDVVLACSALTRSARGRLARGIAVRFVHLHVAPEVLAARLEHRAGHFMPAGLLDSQLATLEVPGPDEALVVDADRPLDAVVDEIVARR